MRLLILRKCVYLKDLVAYPERFSKQSLINVN